MNGGGIGGEAPQLGLDAGELGSCCGADGDSSADLKENILLLHFVWLFFPVYPFETGSVIS